MFVITMVIAYHQNRGELFLELILQGKKFFTANNANNVIIAVYCYGISNHGNARGITLRPEAAEAARIAEPNRTASSSSVKRTGSPEEKEKMVRAIKI